MPSGDAIAGGAGGVTSVLLGQPFDLIRVRLQTIPNSTISSIVRTTLTTEGPLAFYKGASLPLLGVGACVSIQFATFHGCKRAFSSSLPVSLQNYLFGGLAGVANSIISGPVEHIRTRLQLQPHGQARWYNGPIDCMRQVIRQAGPTGLYKAYHMALAKEFQAYGCYFAAFEASIAALSQIRNKPRSEMSSLEVVPCGAAAGIAFWCGSYPIDVVKTKLQGDKFGREAVYSSARAVVTSTWRESGIRGFWKGLPPTLIRTGLSSAGCFVVVEKVHWLLGRQEDVVMEENPQI